jgi:hypothetical protein
MAIGIVGTMNGGDTITLDEKGETTASTSIFITDKAMRKPTASAVG